MNSVRLGRGVRERVCIVLLCAGANQQPLCLDHQPTCTHSAVTGLLFLALFGDKCSSDFKN